MFFLAAFKLFDENAYDRNIGGLKLNFILPFVRPPVFRLSVCLSVRLSVRPFANFHVTNLFSDFDET